MTLDLNIPVLDLNEKRVGDGTLGQLLASQLMASNEGDSIKFYDWALKFHNNKPVELDKSDYQTLKSFIEKSITLTNLAKAQILNYMFECESVKSNGTAKGSRSLEKAK